MTHALAKIALAVGDSLLMSIIAKATLIIMAALIGARMARRSRAAVRHALLASAFAVLLVLPAASLLFPTVPLVRVPLSAERTTESTVVLASDASSPSARPVGVVPRALPPFPSIHFSATSLLRAGWLIGTLLFLLPLIVGLWQVRALCRQGQPWRDGELLARQLARAVGIRAHVEVILHNAQLGPVTCGVVRPTIVLPVEAQTWAESDLSRAFIHELEHVKRKDWLVQCVTRGVCALYWFHPLIWVAGRQLTLEAERACDDAVLRRGEPTSYAHQLVALAKRMSTGSNPSVLTMSNHTDLAARVVAILDQRQQRGPLGNVCFTLVCVFSALLVVTLSPLRLAIAAQVPAAVQKFTGSLTDPVGRPVPQAVLSLSNTTAQRRVEDHSDETGHFAFNEVHAGEYVLEIQKFGFAPFRERIILKDGQPLNRNIQLQVGGIDEEVTVYSSTVPRELPPPPLPSTPSESAAQTYMGQQALDECAQASMFCRITPPHKIADPQPIYPANLRASGVGGQVAVEGLVGKDGLLRDLHTVVPANPDFVRATMDALGRWQFTTTRLDGVPIEVPIRVTTEFVVQ